MIECLYRIP